MSKPFPYTDNEGWTIRFGWEFTLAYGNYVQEYRKNAVNGASPLQLVIMLYDGALRFMEAGKYAMVQKNIDMQNTNLQKAQRIVSELMAALDMEKGGEVAKNLMGLYSFVINSLIESNIKDDVKLTEACIKIFSDLRESWVTLEQRSRENAQEEPIVAA